MRLGPQGFSLSKKFGVVSVMRVGSFFNRVSAQISAQPGVVKASVWSVGSSV